MEFSLFLLGLACGFALGIYVAHLCDVAFERRMEAIDKRIAENDWLDKQMVD